MSDREAFEKWITVFYNNEVPRKLDDGVYIDNDIRTRWIAWKASRAQAIDECVKTLQEMPAIVLRYEGEIVTECMRPSWSDCIEKLKAMIKEQP